MKKYNRAMEKINSLTSVNRYTIFDFNEEDRKESRVSDGGDSQGRTSYCSRKDNGDRRNKPGRSGKKDRRNKIQYQQDNAPEVSGQYRFFAEDCREHRSQCGYEGQKSEDLIEVVETTFTMLSEL